MTNYSSSINIITTYNTHEMYNEIWRGGCGENGHCPQVWTVIHSCVVKTEHRIMHGGWEGVLMNAL